MSALKSESFLYTGTLHHCRTTPRSHDFSYNVAMFYLDLAEVGSLFNIPFFLSTRSPRLMGFSRKDYLIASKEGRELPLDQAVRALIFSKTGLRSVGPIRLLTQIRYFGFCFNPVSFYYCFDERGEALEFVVAEITNTPWNERKAYVLECKPGSTEHRFEFKKDFHVSPFFKMDLNYVWNFDSPAPHASESLSVHMEDWDPESGKRVFFATLKLKPEPLSRRVLMKAVLNYPLLTFKTFFAIYFQALRLVLKRIPFYSHPTSGGQP